MKVILTIHAAEKLKSEEAKLLGINKRRLLEVLKEPVVVNKKVDPHQSVGKLDGELSLVVIWKTEGGKIKVVTFYPAEKGRYESKVLRRR